jgi:hypothetical protein
MRKSDHGSAGGDEAAAGDFNAMTTSHRVSVPRMRAVGSAAAGPSAAGLTFDIAPLLGTLRAEASRWRCSWIVS